MKLESKFSIGDVVMEIVNLKKRKWVECDVCDGLGDLKLVNGKQAPCSICHGRKGSFQYEKHNSWHIEGIYTVGQIRIEYTDSPGAYSEINADNYAPQKSTKEEYMCVETGIGSGRLYRGENLFLAEKEALEECERRNEKRGDE